MRMINFMIENKQLKLIFYKILNITFKHKAIVEYNINLIIFNYLFNLKIILLKIVKNLNK